MEKTNLPAIRDNSVELNIFSVQHIFLNYPNTLRAKKKLLPLLEEQKKLFGNTNKIWSKLQTSQRDEIYETIVDVNNTKRYVYNLQGFLNIIEDKIPLNVDQRTKISAAFLLTQDGFANKMRKTGGPAFSHILEVVKFVLKTKNCTFERILKALLHDNIEDLKDFDLYEYTYLFGKDIIDADLELSHKPWYHRIGFLPVEQRKILHEKILAFANTDDVKGKTKKFSIQIGQNNPDNFYQGLDMLWNVMDPDDADKLRTQLIEAPETKDIMELCMSVSDFRFFDKKLSDENLPIKFADRLQNTQILFNNPIKSIFSLFETQYHFFSENRKDYKNVKNRMKKYPLATNPDISHYDILKNEIQKQKDITKQQIASTGKLKQNFDQRYDIGYKLYIEKTEILRAIDKNRKVRCKSTTTTEEMKILELQLDVLANQYTSANKKFLNWMNIL